jgi:hypothetical protein
MKPISKRAEFVKRYTALLRVAKLAKDNGMKDMWNTKREQLFINARKKGIV